MVGLPPGQTYGCILTCMGGGTGDVAVPDCGSTSAAGKTSISRRGFFDPDAICLGPVLAFEFWPGTPARCSTGFGSGNPIELCGPAICGPGTVCCDPLHGICAPPGHACPQG